MQTINDIHAQVKSNKLQFMGVGNFAQHKVYVDVVDMEIMLAEKFWVALVRGSSGDRLFPGDTLTIRQVEWEDMSRDKIKKVICRADCEVVATGKKGAIIAPLHKHYFTEKKAADPEANDSKHAEQKGLERKWNPVDRHHEVCKDGAVVHTTKDKDEADAMVAGDIPLPEIKEHSPVR